MEIKIGDYVSRNSYNNDVVFEVIDIMDGLYIIRGIKIRLIADAPAEDLKVENKIEDKDDNYSIIDDLLPANRDQFFYLPGKILHLDGDDNYLKQCIRFYQDAGVPAIGKCIKETEFEKHIFLYLKEYNPDILIITGHDAYYSKNGDKSNLKNYQNSLNFVNAVRKAREYEKSQDKLVIIAGACQSNYEELIKSGANYASSPRRINIHALDPAIIAVSVALTEKNKKIDLIELLNRTKYGHDGMGGIMGQGVMYIGYPK